MLLFLLTFSERMKAGIANPRRVGLMMPNSNRNTERIRGRPGPQLHLCQSCLQEFTALAAALVDYEQP